MDKRVIFLRMVHGLFAAYFILCLVYMYYVVIVGRIDWLLLVAVISLGLEGIVVFGLNKGDCPLIHVQRRIGDDKPFFELFLKPKAAKRAIPVFAWITWVGVGLLSVRLLLEAY